MLVLKTILWTLHHITAELSAVLIEISEAFKGSKTWCHSLIRRLNFLILYIT